MHAVQFRSRGRKIVSICLRFRPSGPKVSLMFKPFNLWFQYLKSELCITRGCGRWGAARYGTILAAEYGQTEGRPLPWQRGHPGQGGKGSLRHLPNIKLIGQQAAKLWEFFANNAISRPDLDLWLLDLVIGPGVLVSQGPFLPSFVYVGFSFSL